MGELNSFVKEGSNNISKAFISSKAYSSKINTILMQGLHRAMHDDCRRNRFTIVNNGAVTENDLWVDGVHLQSPLSKLNPLNPLR